MPTIKLHAEIEGKYQPILTLIAAREIYLESPYKDRVRGWRNMSVASIEIHNFTSDDYTNYKLRIGHTSLQKDEESIISLRQGGKTLLM